MHPYMAPGTESMPLPHSPIFPVQQQREYLTQQSSIEHSGMPERMREYSGRDHSLACLMENTLWRIPIAWG